MAQAVANHALDGPSRHLDDGRGDRACRCSLRPGGTTDLVAATGARVDQLPELGISGQPLAEVDGYDDCVLEGGTIDAMGEQLVAGADEPGDVLVILGTTLIVWAVVPDRSGRRSVLLRAAHRTGGVWLVGGPSNAGGLFLELGRRGSSVRRHRPSGGHDAVRPHDVPVWVPYPRGERVPLNDSTRRARARRPRTSRTTPPRSGAPRSKRRGS